jgi:hypothetical protein
MGLVNGRMSRLLRNSCRPLKRTQFVSLSLTRHCRAGLSDAAAMRLGWSLSCRQDDFIEFRNSLENRETWGTRYLGRLNESATLPCLSCAALIQVSGGGCLRRFCGG